MSGYLRQGRTNALAAAPIVVVDFVSEREIARVIREQDPFGLAHGCTNPAGHQPAASCGEIVCVHCGRIFWR